MSQYAAAGLSRHCMSLSRLAGFPGRNSCSGSKGCSFTANSAPAVTLTHLCSPKAAVRQLRLGHFVRFSGSGSGGGSGDGNSGGGDGGGGAGGESSGGSDWSFLSWYLGLLAKYPVRTKAITSALLTFIGDLVCQVVIDQVPSIDLKRIFLFTFLGLVLVGPTLHCWYLYLSKLVTTPGSSGAIIRLLLDQFLFSPLFIGFFLSTLVTLEGRPTQVVPKL